MAYRSKAKSVQFYAPYLASVSNESLVNDMVDSIKRIFADKKPQLDEKAKLHYQASVTKFKEQYNRTYLNPTWLSIQRFVEGTVSSEGIVADLVSNGKVPDNLVAAVHAHISESEKLVDEYAKLSDPYIAKVNEIIDHAARLPHGEVVHYLETAMKTLPALKRLENFTGKGLLGDTSYLAHMLTGKPYANAPVVKGPTQLPALTKDQVVKYAGLVMLLINESSRIKDSKEIQSIDDIETRWDDRKYDTVLNSDDGTAIFGKLHYSNHEATYVSTCVEFVLSFFDIVTALDKWISRSID